MKIVVVDTAASTGGALSVLRDFYEYVKYNCKHIEWVFLLSDKYIDETDNIRVVIFPKAKKSWINRLSFDFYDGARIMQRLNPDLVFSLQNTAIRRVKTPQALYVHQSLPFQSEYNFSLFVPQERKLFVYQHLIGFFIKRSIRTADSVIVQTEWMKNAVIAQAGVSGDKIKCVSPDLPPIHEFADTNSFSCTEFFYPTSAEFYKNIPCILEACKILNSNGINNFSVQITIDGISDSKNVVYIGNMSREAVIRQYRHSTLLFPSYVETYGLPLAEARNVGTMILASKCSFSYEVLKDYQNAYFFNPHDSKELASLMEQVIDKKIQFVPQEPIGKTDVRGWKQICDTLYSCALMGR